MCKAEKQNEGKTKYEIASVIRQFADEYVKVHRPNTWVLRTLNALQMCRTSALGGHKEQCDSCGYIRYSYNSCRNRHCPKCQPSRQAFWVEDVSEKILDTKYFHIIFTVPEELNKICILDSKGFYGTLFSSVWQTLRTFGYTYYGVESGALAILHTWGQNLSLHPHIHCLVPAAGIDLAGKMKKIGKKGRYLYPVQKLSIDFRSVMMKKLKKQLSVKGVLPQYQTVIDKAWSKKWVVFTEPSFADAEKVIRYLGNYTHRVAIVNSRIQNIDKRNVSFYYKDYRDKGRRKLLTLSGVEFLRRFAMHILPKGFVKIRYFGVMSNRFSKQTVMYRKTGKRPKNETTLQRITRLSGFDVTICPHCKTGHMQIVGILPRIRAPGNSLLSKHENIKL